MRCIVCGWSAEMQIWVRPITGGRRRGFAVCDEICKQYELDFRAAEGLKETFGVLGWDVFIPVWLRDE